MRRLYNPSMSFKHACLLAGVAYACWMCCSADLTKLEHDLDAVTCKTNCSDICTVKNKCIAKCCEENCNICSNEGCVTCFKCDSHVCGELCTPGLTDDICRSRCEVKRWLHCSTGFGGCNFHKGNSHFSASVEKLESLKKYGLTQDQCRLSLDAHRFEGESCENCQSLFDQAVQEMAQAAQLATYIDKDILWTPKEAILHMQRCACLALQDDPIEQSVHTSEDLVQRFSDFSVNDRAGKQRECFWSAWLEEITGGSAAYTVSSTIQDFQNVLERYRNMGFQLTASAYSNSKWLAWWETLSTVEAKWVVESSLSEFSIQLENAKREGYTATSITYGEGFWVAWFWKQTQLHSTWVLTRNMSDFVTNMKDAVSEGKRLQAVAYGEDTWIGWFQSRLAELPSKWIVSQSYEDMYGYTQEMISQDYFATAMTFGNNIWVMWFDYNPNKDSQFVTYHTDASFINALHSNLRGTQMMVTGMLYGCRS